MHQQHRIGRGRYRQVREANADSWNEMEVKTKGLVRGKGEGRYTGIKAYPRVPKNVYYKERFDILANLCPPYMLYKFCGLKGRPIFCLFSWLRLSGEKFLVLLRSSENITEQFSTW